MHYLTQVVDTFRQQYCYALNSAVERSLDELGPPGQAESEFGPLRQEYKAFLECDFFEHSPHGPEDRDELGRPRERTSFR